MRTQPIRVVHRTTGNIGIRSARPVLAFGGGVNEVQLESVAWAGLGVARLQR